MKPLQIIWSATVRTSTFDWPDPASFVIERFSKDSDSADGAFSIPLRLLATYMYPSRDAALLSRHFASACSDNGIPCSADLMRRHFRIQNLLYWRLSESPEYCEIPCESPQDVFSVLDFFELWGNVSELWTGVFPKISIRLTGDSEMLSGAVGYWSQNLFQSTYMRGMEFLRDEYGYPRSRLAIETVESSAPVRLPEEVLIPRPDSASLFRECGRPKLPTRKNLRFLSYHFFWYAHFSEERRDSVDYLRVFSSAKSLIDAEIEGGQFEIVESVLLGKRTLGILSTGSGKTHTFLLAGYLLPGTTLVISPLKSLIEDQCDNLKRKFGFSILVDKIHGGMDKDSKDRVLEDVRIGEIKYLYVAPERLQIRKFFDSCARYSAKLNMIAIDEAHCLSEWGHDFRLSYLNVRPLVEDIGNASGGRVSILALTATAWFNVYKDIVGFLGIERTVRESSLNRPNISLQVIRMSEGAEKMEKLKHVLGKEIPEILRNSGHDDPNPPGIVFTIYGWIGKKSAEGSVQATAEAIYRSVIADMDEEERQLVGMYYGSNPSEWADAVPDGKISCCPACRNIDPTVSIRWTTLKGFFRGKWAYESHRDWFDQVEGIETAKSAKASDSSARMLLFDRMAERYVNPENADFWKKPRVFEIKTGVEYWCNVCGETYDEYGYVEDPQEILLRGSPRISSSTDRWEKIKQETQDRFKKGDSRLLVATKGFWMGIDKSDIRFVVHYVMPQSLEGYYQEIWRAGRDGGHSHCTVFFTPPCESCRKDTDDLESDPPCLTDAQNFQYMNCPYGMEGPCDYFRQQRMIVSPPTVHVWKAPFPKIRFLHDLLAEGRDPETESVRVQKGDFPVKLGEALHELGIRQTGFSHPLVEFWQFRYSIQKVVYPKFRSEEAQISMREVSEKTIFRCMILGIVKRYFKNYAKGVFEVEWSSGDRSEASAQKFLVEKLSVDPKDLDRYLSDSQFAKLASDIASSPAFDAVQKQWLKAALMMVYHLYSVIDVGRKKAFSTLFRSIQSVSWSGSGCLRAKLLVRLSKDGATEEDFGKCGFCSGCVSDNRYSASEGLLEPDRMISESNAKFRSDGFVWFEKAQKAYDEALSKKKSRLLEIETLLENRVFRPEAIAVLLEDLSESSSSAATTASQMLERGTFVPNAIFLDAYYRVKEGESPPFQKIAERMFQYDGIDPFRAMVATYGAFDEHARTVVDSLLWAAPSAIPPDIVDAHTMAKFGIGEESLLGLALAASLLEP